MRHISLLLLLQTLSAVRSCDEYATSNQSSCAQYDSKMCQKIIAGVKSQLECNKQDITQPCHLASMTTFLVLDTFAGAALGIWIVILYTIFGLKTNSQCFYSSALFLAISDLVASTGAYLLYVLINIQAKALEDAGCLSNATFMSLESIRKDVQTLSCIGILKIVFNITFTLSFAAELASMTCRFKKKYHRVVLNRSGSERKQDCHAACNERCKTSFCDFCAKGANWLLIMLAAAIACGEAFRANKMLKAVNSIFIDGQKTGETSWCLHCRSGVRNSMELEAEYEAESDRNMNIAICILTAIGGLFLLHSVIIACISCPVKEAHYAVSDDDNGGGPEAHEPDADDGGCEQEHLSRRVSIDKNRQTNRNKVSHDDQPRITS